MKEKDLIVNVWCERPTLITMQCNVCVMEKFQSQEVRSPTANHHKGHNNL